MLYSSTYCCCIYCVVMFCGAVDDAEIWPRTMKNTILNVCARGDVMVIERLGKLHRIQTEGYFFAIPFVDNIRFCVDMRER